MRKTGCSVRGFWVIIERFSRRRPRKSRDNHSKTSNRASCVPNSFPEKAQNLKCAFSWTLFSFTSEQIFHCSEENNANPRKWFFISFFWVDNSFLRGWEKIELVYPDIFPAQFCFLIAMWCFPIFLLRTAIFAFFSRKGRLRSQREQGGRAAFEGEKGKNGSSKQKNGKTSH